MLPAGIARCFGVASRDALIDTPSWAGTFNRIDACDIPPRAFTWKHVTRAVPPRPELADILSHTLLQPLFAGPKSMLAESPASHDRGLDDGQSLGRLQEAASRLAGYGVRAVISEGNFGVVWNATDTNSGKTVACKRLRKQPAGERHGGGEKLAR